MITEQVKTTTNNILEAEWITEEAWHSDLQDARAKTEVCYGRSKAGAHEWQERKCKWHGYGLDKMLQANKRQTAILDNRTEEGDLLWATSAE